MARRIKDKLTQSVSVALAKEQCIHSIVSPGNRVYISFFNFYVSSRPILLLFSQFVSLTETEIQIYKSDMDKRKIVTYIIIRMWHLHMMAMFLMMILIINRRRRNNKVNMLRNDFDIEENSPMSESYRSTATSSRSRKRNRSSDTMENAIMRSFENMFERSIEQLSCMVDKFVKGNEDCSDISKELRAMGLSNEDHIEVLQAIIDKPQNVSIFKSVEGDLQKIFVMKLLRQIRGD